MSATPHFESMLIVIPPNEIVMFKSIVESYDNLATLRTEEPRTHQLRIYFAPEARAEVEALLDSLTERFQLRRLA